MSMCKKTE